MLVRSKWIQVLLGFGASLAKVVFFVTAVLLGTTISSGVSGGGFRWNRTAGAQSEEMRMCAKSVLTMPSW